MFSRRAIHCLLMLAIAVAVQAGSVSVLHASCGDYLTGHELRESLLAREAASDQHAPLPTSSLPKVPCHGPGCQKAPSGPPAPAPIKVSQPETQRLGCLVAELTLRPARQTLPDADRIELPRSGERSSIEHPPRS